MLENGSALSGERYLEIWLSMKMSPPSGDGLSVEKTRYTHFVFGILSGGDKLQAVKLRKVAIDVDRPFNLTAPPSKSIALSFTLG